MAKPASRLSDLNACPLPGHGTNPTTNGSGDVLVGTQSGSAPFSPPEILPRHSEQYQLIDENSGQPVEDILYCVECGDGQRFVGYTNAYGNTERVFTGDPQSVVVRWGRDAANYLKKKGISF